MEPQQTKIEENRLNLQEKEQARNPYKPTAAFIGASWLALLTGTVAFCIGLWNADMALNEKG